MTETQKKIGIGALAAVVIIAVIALQFSSEPVEKEPSQVENAKTEAKTEKAVTSQKNGKSQSKEEREARAEQNKERLLELMDDAEENHDAALELAMQMAETGTNEEKLDAVRCFEWFGDTKSVKGLLTVIQGTTGDLQKEGRQSLQHILARSNYDEDGLDKESWLSVIQNDSDPEALSHYFHLLGTLDNPKSVPILMELLDSENEDIKKEAQELISSIASGDEILTRKEAEAWWQTYQKEHPEEFEK
ncbi:MAG: HEAT repeat domain-containing protein [Victivallales bacterium]|nr:HEAT repeat domain-containing protein [Victivallales bacterium]